MIEDPPRAWGTPPAVAVLRQKPDDFRVDEELGFSPDGEGQHLFLRICKRDSNTQWVARQLARVARVPLKAVGYAGLKDRRAVTSQWFSLDLAGKAEPDWGMLESDGIRLLEKVRHGRKLRRGSLAGNRFTLVLRALEGDREAVEQRLRRIEREGVPNYFGEQRFGRDGANLQQALALFQGEIRIRDRHRRGICLSAARSMLFNRVLGRRVEAACWQHVLPGEAVMLAGSRSFFSMADLTSDIERRVAEGDLLPSAPLWGRGDSPAQGEALALEKAALEGLEAWCRGLEAAGLRQERRATLLRPQRFSWEWLGKGALRLRFFLPAGGYATAVVRELARLRC